MDLILHLINIDVHITRNILHNSNTKHTVICNNMMMIGYLLHFSLQGPVESSANQLSRQDHAQLRVGWGEVGRI